jgi:hypothetical protein
VFSRYLSRILVPLIFFAVGAVTPLFAQELPVASPPPPQVAPTPAGATTLGTKADEAVVPTGTRFPLMLRNGINTRTAKAGDSVYFETLYPIAVHNRIAIPMGTFVRGRILEAKRPGRIQGRGEFRIALEQMTYPNGYTIDLLAMPSSVDRNGQEGVDSEGKIKGPSSKGRDAATVLVAAGGGAYIGAAAGGILNEAPGRGALIGAGAGAVADLIAVLLTRGPEAELPRGTTLDVAFDRPLVLDADHLPANDPGKLSQPLAPATTQRETHRRERGPIRTRPGLPFPFFRF